MKLSDYKGEEALDLLADLLEPASVIFTDKAIVESIRERQPMLKTVQAVIKTHKKEVIEILATLDGIPVDEYEVNLFTLPSKILELVNDPELITFFTSQEQMNIQGISSQSASETIEETRE